jgi:hypothetical protein
VETCPTELYFRTLEAAAVSLSKITKPWVLKNPVTIIFGFPSTRQMVVGISSSVNP